MDIFEELLNSAQVSYKGDRFDRAFELLQAATKFLKGLIDAKKLTAPKEAPKSKPD